ncbi:MAG: hypothetical protein GXP55_19560 [Deltaproteobacteria bacterium]|nr:hypothetical protein [Deltaproteobacteria bacterium]
MAGKHEDTPRAHPCLLWAALLCGLLAPLHAHAQARVSLSWDAANVPGCLSAQELRAAVETRLRRQVFTEEQGSFRLAGRIEDREGDVVATLDLRDPQGASLGRRVLSAHGPCASLSDSLALVVSLLVEQNRQRIVLYVPPPAPTPARARVAAPAAHAREHRSEGGGVRFSYALGASVRGVDAPWPTYGALQLLRLGWARLPLDFALEGSVTWPQRVRSGDAAADVWGFRVGGGVCPRFARGWLRPLTCLTFLAGRQYAEGRGLDLERSGSATTATLVLRAGLEARVWGALELGFALRGELALLRANLVTGSAGAEQVLFDGAPVGLGADLWLSIALGSR